MTIVVVLHGAAAATLRLRNGLKENESHRRYAKAYESSYMTEQLAKLVMVLSSQVQKMRNRTVRFAGIRFDVQHVFPFVQEQLIAWLARGWNVSRFENGFQQEAVGQGQGGRLQSCRRICWCWFVQGRRLVWTPKVQVQTFMQSRLI